MSCPSYRDRTFPGTVALVYPHLNPATRTVRVRIELANHDLLLKPDERVVVVWQTNPPPMDAPGLTHFRVEIVSSDRVVVWETPLIKSGSGKTARRNRAASMADAV